MCYLQNCCKIIKLSKLCLLLIVMISSVFYVVKLSKSRKLKYVLLWAHSDNAPFYYFTEKDVFIKNNCSFNNCYVTDDKDYFGGDLSRFHAIAFNGRLLGGLNVTAIPRSPHQKFIYVNTEASVHFPLFSKKYDGFFNWTSTYKLSSDIPYPYLLIKDSLGNIVGPKQDMKWKSNMTEIDEEIIIKLLKKNKVAVAFVSNCKDKTKRMVVMQKISLALEALGYGLDIFGKCGTKQCRRGMPQCDSLVEEYYFYLAFENAFSEDYVTEKVLRAFRHGSVPIVRGGANYSRFLPPGSYLNAREYSPVDLAAHMVKLMRDPDEYLQFFGWTKHYSFHDPMTRENVWALCAALNNKTMYRQTSQHNDIRTWWNEIKPRYKSKAQVQVEDFIY